MSDEIKCEDCLSFINRVDKDWVICKSGYPININGKYKCIAIGLKCPNFEEKTYDNFNFQTGYYKLEEDNKRLKDALKYSRESYRYMKEENERLKSENEMLKLTMMKLKDELENPQTTLSNTSQLEDERL